MTTATLRCARWACDTPVRCHGRAPHHRMPQHHATVHSPHRRAQSSRTAATAPHSLPPPLPFPADRAPSVAVLSTATPAPHVARARHHGRIPYAAWRHSFAVAVHRRHRHPLAVLAQPCGSPQKNIEAVRQQSFILPSLYPLGPLCGPLPRPSSPSLVPPAAAAGKARIRLRAARVIPAAADRTDTSPFCPLTRRSSPSARHFLRGLALFTSNNAPFPRRASAVAVAAAPASFPSALLLFPFLFAPPSQSHFVEGGNPSPPTGWREPRRSPSARGQGSGLSPESSSFQIAIPIRFDQSQTKVDKSLRSRNER